MNSQASHFVRVKAYEGWATPAPHLTLDELIARFEAKGQKIMEIDRANNRVKLCGEVFVPDEPENKAL